MPSEHINIKLNEKYYNKLKKIGKTLGIKDLSSTYGGIPTIIRFCITYTDQELDKLYKVIPTLHPNDLQVLLLSIKTKKTEHYHKERLEKKKKMAEGVILKNLGKQELHR